MVKGVVETPTVSAPVVEEIKPGHPLYGVRPSSMVKEGMAETIELPQAERWQKVGGHLVSITAVHPDRPYSTKRKYVFRETVAQLDAMSKAFKEENP